MTPKYIDHDGTIYAMQCGEVVTMTHTPDGIQWVRVFNPHPAIRYALEHPDLDRRQSEIIGKDE